MPFFAFGKETTSQKWKKMNLAKKEEKKSEQKIKIIRRYSFISLLLC